MGLEEKQPRKHARIRRPPRGRRRPDFCPSPPSPSRSRRRAPQDDPADPSTPGRSTPLRLAFRARLLRGPRRSSSSPRRCRWHQPRRRFLSSSVERSGGENEEGASPVGWRSVLRRRRGGLRPRKGIPIRTTTRPRGGAGTGPPPSRRGHSANSPRRHGDSSRRRNRNRNRRRRRCHRPRSPPLPTLRGTPALRPNDPLRRNRLPPPLRRYRRRRPSLLPLERHPRLGRPPRNLQPGQPRRLLRHLPLVPRRPRRPPRPRPMRPPPTPRGIPPRRLRPPGPARMPPRPVGRHAPRHGRDSLP
mmetsp:Transcript_18169/g.36336  ORF Transcript_18169/g.36336 Transcript_18169/m.36336 type:complete len:302 (-) Transcript_18169:1975-2880(-)